MAKVRLEGDIKFEFDVRYGLKEDLVIQVHAISVGNNKYILIGEGELSNISEKTLEFIGDRIESLLSKNKSKLFIGINCMGKFFKYETFSFKEMPEDKEITKSMYQTELGTLIMRAYRWHKDEALEEVLQRNLFPLSKDGMREFIVWKKTKEKAKELSGKEKEWPLTDVRKVYLIG